MSNIRSGDGKIIYFLNSWVPETIGGPTSWLGGTYGFLLTQSLLKGKDDESSFMFVVFRVALSNLSKVL